MIYDEAVTILRRGHDDKAPFSALTARDRADMLRRSGFEVTAYRCIWPECHRWHVGHVPSQIGVVRMAEAIRTFHEGPEPQNPVEIPKKSPPEDRQKPTVTREVSP